MNNKIILVVGGARSGKSSFAQEIVEKLNRKTVYIATAQPKDDEMRQRIVKHQAERPHWWKTVEEPLKLADAILTSGKDADVILVDCLTLYISNLLSSYIGDLTDVDNPVIDSNLEKQSLGEINCVIKAACQVKPLVVFVANEVGHGLVPLYNLGRLYRDLAGRANQQAAKVADKVFWLQSGIPLELKQYSVSTKDIVKDLNLL